MPRLHSALAPALRGRLTRVRSRPRPWDFDDEWTILLRRGQARVRAVGDLFNALMLAHQVRGAHFARVTALFGILAAESDAPASITGRVRPRALSQVVPHRVRVAGDEHARPARRGRAAPKAWRARGQSARGAVQGARGARARELLGPGCLISGLYQADTETDMLYHVCIRPYQPHTGSIRNFLIEA